MELSKEHTFGDWTKDDNGKPQFYIINETNNNVLDLDNQFSNCLLDLSNLSVIFTTNFVIGIITFRSKKETIL